MLCTWTYELVVTTGHSCSVVFCKCFGSEFQMQVFVLIHLDVGQLQLNLRFAALRLALLSEREVLTCDFAVHTSTLARVAPPSGNPQMLKVPKHVGRAVSLVRKAVVVLQPIHPICFQHKLMR